MSPPTPRRTGRENADGQTPKAEGRNRTRNLEPSTSGTAGLDTVSSPLQPAAPPQTAPENTATGPKRWWRSSLLGIIGFLLSPLSWWNDLFINVPLALGLAWGVALIWPAAFEAVFITGYWLTNVLGLVLLTRGAKELLAGRPSPYSRRELLKDLLVAAGYTALIVTLVHFKVLQPLQHYRR